LKLGRLIDAVAARHPELTNSLYCFRDSVIKALHTLPQVTSVDLSNNGLSYVPKCLAEMANLKILDLRNNPAICLPWGLPDAFPNLLEFHINAQCLRKPDMDPALQSWHALRASSTNYRPYALQPIRVIQ
jgi:hypothetical protein